MYVNLIEDINEEASTIVRSFYGETEHFSVSVGSVEVLQNLALNPYLFFLITNVYNV